MTRQTPARPTAERVSDESHAVDRSVTQRTVNGLTFRAVSSHRRAPNALAFVLVHGLGTSHKYFTRLHRELSAHGDVHSIDLPGFGGLPKPAGAPDVAEISNALATVLEDLGVSGGILVGHSMGAQWAVELALQHPERASAVVVCGPVTDRRHRSLSAQMLLLVTDFLREPLALNVMVFRDYLRCGPLWYATQVRHMLRYRLDERVALLRMPLLIVRGSADVIAGQRWCTQLKESAPSADVVVIPRHRHLAQFTAAADVARRIHEFVRRIPA
ncbi:alpha/beta fold hydrolase [Microbacterium sp. 1P10AE]|uniref:alpha/beta fold hydrolase n=1 Tax=Microbacterium sp. 1P10AE TaxID=3132286 RepID=UPI00399FD33B